MAAIDVTAQIDAHQTQHLDRVRAFIRQPSISADGTGIPAMADLVAATIPRAVRRVSRRTWLRDTMLY